jgi:hypothetical protein
MTYDYRYPPRPPTADEQRRTGQRAIKGGAVVVGIGAAMAGINAICKPPDPPAPTVAITIPESPDGKAPDPALDIFSGATFQIGPPPKKPADPIDACAVVEAATGAGMMLEGARRMWTASRRKRREEDGQERS